MPAWQDARFAAKKSLQANPAAALMSDLDVVMLNPGLARLEERLSGAVRLHRLWQAPDPASLLAQLAPRLRAIVATSHSHPIDDAMMARLPKLEIIASFGVGYDHINAKAAAARGIVVTHTPGVLDDDVADIAMALTLNAVRRLPQAEAYLRAGEWRQAPFALTASLRGRRMGILGLGRIGKAVAARAQAFGLALAYHGRSAQKDCALTYYPTLLGLAEACDILVVAAPGGAGTRHIVNGEVLDALGAQGVLINVSRGSLVDEAALIEALKTGRILAAGLDVFENEPNVPEALLALDNAVLLPHVGSASHATRAAMADLVVDNLLGWLDGRKLKTPVPETPWPR